MLAAVLAIVWGCACAALSWRYPRSVDRATDDELDAAIRDELDEAANDAEKVAAINELLADVERSLETHAATPKLAGWLAVAGVALLLVVGALVRPEPLLAIGVVGALIGVVAAVVARSAGDRRAERARARADERVRAHAGALYDAEIVLPIRPTRRFRGR